MYFYCCNLEPLLWGEHRFLNNLWLTSHSNGVCWTPWQYIGLQILGTLPVYNNTKVFLEYFCAMYLSSIKLDIVCKTWKVLMICENHVFEFCTLKEMPPLLKCIDISEQFLIENVIITLCWRQFAGLKSASIYISISKLLWKDRSPCEIRSVCVDQSGSILVKLSKYCSFSASIWDHYFQETCLLSFCKCKILSVSC